MLIKSGTSVVVELSRPSSTLEQPEAQKSKNSDFKAETTKRQLEPEPNPDGSELWKDFQSLSLNIGFNEVENSSSEDESEEDEDWTKNLVAKHPTRIKLTLGDELKLQTQPYPAKQPHQLGDASSDLAYSHDDLFAISATETERSSGTNNVNQQSLEDPYAEVINAIESVEHQKFSEILKNSYKDSDGAFGTTSPTSSTSVYWSPCSLSSDDSHNVKRTFSVPLRNTAVVNNLPMAKVQSKREISANEHSTAGDTTILRKSSCRALLPNCHVSPVLLTGSSKSTEDRYKEMCKCNATKVMIHYEKVLLEEDFYQVNDQQQTKLVQLLVEKGKKNDFFERLFVRVTKLGNKEVKKEEKIKNLEKRDANGRSALHIAALHHTDYPIISRFIAEAYLQLGLNPDQECDSGGNHLLHILAEHGDSHAGVMAELLSMTDSGQPVFNVNQTNKNLMTPLHFAAQSQSIACTDLLLRKCSSLGCRDADGRTALQTAVSRMCSPAYVKVLLGSPSAAQIINLRDNEGNTALHIASFNTLISSHTRNNILHQLKTSGACSRIENRWGMTPFSADSQIRLSQVFVLSNSTSQAFWESGQSHLPTSDFY